MRNLPQGFKGPSDFSKAFGKMDVAEASTQFEIREIVERHKARKIINLILNLTGDHDIPEHIAYAESRTIQSPQ